MMSLYSCGAIGREHIKFNAIVFQNKHLLHFFGQLKSFPSFRVNTS